MSGTIYIVRHGQDEDNASGILNGRRDKALTVLGRNQAAKIARKLASHNITAIYSSPLKRARETAEIIARHLGVDGVVVKPDLIERDFGIMTGKPVTDIARLSKYNLQGDRVLYFIEPAEAETFPELLERAHRILDYLQTHKDGNLLLVSHGDIGKMIQAAYHGWDWQTALMAPYLDNSGVLELQPKKDVVG